MAEPIAFPFFTGGRKSASEKKRPLEKVCREEPYSNGLKFLEVLFKFTFLNLFYMDVFKWFSNVCNSLADYRNK